MATKDEIEVSGRISEPTKAELIRKETNRLKRVFRDLDKNKMTTVLSLIESITKIGRASCRERV